MLPKIRRHDKNPYFRYFIVLIFMLMRGILSALIPTGKDDPYAIFMDNQCGIMRWRDAVRRLR
jgi:hypothetical protein